VLCRHLSSEWTLNEQYNYGWFVPFFAAYLFWLRWEDRPEIGNQRAEVGGPLVSVSVFLLLLLLPVRLFEIANPDWRPLGWVHTAIVVGLTLLVIWSVGGAVWLRHFAFPILFFFVAVPWVTAMEAPVVEGLMRGIAAAASETLTLFGIPAQVEGNLIRVSSGLVGVNEACSGVRSLQTSLMIGLLFGELKRLSVAGRLLLVGASIATALIANFARALTLVWIAAEKNVQEVGRWHDLAGYAIVAVVFVVTLAIASRLTSRSQKSEVGSQSNSAAEFRLPASAFIVGLAWLLAVEIGVELWYRSHEWREPPLASWTIAWPTSAPGFRNIPIDEGVRATLRFDEGREATWNAPGARCLLYFFRWNPGGSSVVRARAHRPDICLPAAGWRQTDSTSGEFGAGDALRLPFRRVTFQHASGGTVAQTFFCLHEDRRTSEARPDLQLAAGIQPEWSFAARWRAVRDGVRNMGQQVMEFIMLTPREMSATEAEARFAEMLPTLVRPRS
jgi:exosortase